MAFHLDEPLGIDPCVDVAFLWLFGGEQHEHIRVDERFPGRYPSPCMILFWRKP